MDLVPISSHERRIEWNSDELVGTFTTRKVSLAKIERRVLGLLDKSLMYTLKRIGPKNEPWGTPVLIALVLDSFLLTLTMKDLFVRKVLMIFSIWSGKLYLSSFSKRPLCQTESNALFRSRRSIPVNLFLLCSLAIWWMTLISWRIVDYNLPCGYHYNLHTWPGYQEFLGTPWCHENLHI